jgi:hypothetical protein
MAKIAATRGAIFLLWWLPHAQGCHNETKIGGKQRVRR